MLNKRREYARAGTLQRVCCQAVSKKNRNYDEKFSVKIKHDLYLLVLCFHPFLVSVLFTGPFIHVVNFYGKFENHSIKREVRDKLTTHPGRSVYKLYYVQSTPG